MVDAIDAGSVLMVNLLKLMNFKSKLIAKSHNTIVL